MTDNNKPDFAFIGKYIISADIVLKTGLHIGGTEEGFDIGGIDNPVIKDKVSGLPYIPGSSLKGKMRSLLEWAYFDPSDEKGKTIQISKNNKGEWEGKLCNDPTHPIGIVFGVAAESHKEDLPGPTRLTVRDALPHEKVELNDGSHKSQIEIWEAAMGEKIFTEAKTENAIDRLTSAANPRSMERIPAESVFKVTFIYDLYRPEDRNHLKLLFEGMRLLEDSYLGGGGTRGSGQIKFENLTIQAKDRSSYVGGGGKAVLEVRQNGHNTPDAVFLKFNEIFPPIQEHS
jgi:CRISPR-associated protein Csm3